MVRAGMKVALDPVKGDAMSKVEKLQKHGILATPHGMHPDDVKKIESLSEEEVDLLVKLKVKLGDEFIKRHRDKNPTAMVI
jgi:hypothetical protein